MYNTRIRWDFDWDAMHGIFLNVMLHQLTLLFGETHKSKLYSLFMHLQEAIQILKSSIIPHTDSKAPIDLLNYSEWKAAELR
jgi:hypothetical protein